MDYIINPAWFYWVNVADALNSVLIVFMIISSVLVIISAAITASNASFGEEDSDYKRAKRALKYSVALMLVVGVLLVFVPDKKTLMEMQIARYATYENAEITIDAIKSAVDYIVETMKQLK